MKKLLTITTILAAGTLFANAATTINLVAGVDFNTTLSENVSNGADLSSLNVVSNSTVSITGLTKSTETGTKPLATSDTKVGSSGNGSYNDADIRVAFSDIGLTTTNGFTVAINGQATKNDWKDLFCIQVTDSSKTVTSYEAQYPGTQINIYQGTSGGTEKLVLSGLTQSTWYSFFLTVYGSTYKLYALNLDGELVSSGSFTGVEGTLTQVVQGYLSDDRNGDNKRVDNIGIYDGVLNLDDMKAVTLYEVSNSTMKLSITSIPEPSMFGLLAGTLALGFAGTRRRRRAK